MTQDKAMERAGEIAAKALSTLSSETRQSEMPAKDLPIQALSLIAATMTATFGNKWTSSHGFDFPNTSGRIWAQELAGLGPRQIQRGLDAAKKLEWPPVIAEFKLACLGALPIETVENQMADGAAQHPFTVLVLRSLNRYEYRMASSERQRAMLDHAWRRAKQHLLDGGSLPKPIPVARQLEVDATPVKTEVTVNPIEILQELKKQIARATEEAEAESAPKNCRRCHGLRIDPEFRNHALQPENGEECIECYGSGVEHKFNRIVHPDGTIEVRA